MRTHNLCFGEKIRKIVYPCIPHFHYIKVGFMGVFNPQTCYPDVPKGKARIQMKAIQTVGCTFHTYYR